ncbi:barstar family protein [Dyadobacter aurulentus]|uniref:barstar family protein n=1 Tax=Dyadobacter sp. UC 10 TaxID=2605428 RepID=UPI0011F2D849|nr:barstar family protein [Dyadobacter sp. UC 10]KAA0990316.1 barstar family protein [Dyadobacter sp. UC 10]
MKNTHFLVAPNETEVQKTFHAAVIAHIDGKSALAIKDFHNQISEALQFPDYEGTTLEELDEMLNDLSWIGSKQIIIYISNSEDWLSKEKSREKILTIIDMLDATAEDWKWLDDEEGVDKKELRIIFQQSDRIQALLEEQEIVFGVL